ncbi:MAG: TetR family transcriptional regulator [Planctomycetes bacterium]|nr:TetR family transcriptional regulator [Planctomycetota bacterium]
MQKKNKTMGRNERRRVSTRAAILSSAYNLMSQNGVDGTSIKDVTDLADIGYGTFFNYFENKDEMVLRVLDCAIDDLGRRNDLATAAIKNIHPAEVVCISIRLVIRGLIKNQLWRWSLNRPDLLVERMRLGFHRFGIRDMNVAIAGKRFRFKPDQVETGWSVLIWMLVSCAKDIYDGYSGPESESLVAELILRAMGVPYNDAQRLAQLPLPKTPESEINFSFAIEEHET